MDRALKQGAGAAKDAEALRRKNSRNAQSLLGNEFLQGQVAQKVASGEGSKELDKQLVASLMNLGVKEPVAGGVAQAIAALSETAWDVTAKLSAGKEGVKAVLAGAAVASDGNPQLVQAFKNPYAAEYLHHTIALLCGESVIGAHVEETVNWWKLLGIPSDVADQMGMTLADLGGDEAYKKEKKEQSSAIQLRVGKAVGSVPFSRYA